MAGLALTALAVCASSMIYLYKYQCHLIHCIDRVPSSDYLHVYNPTANTFQPISISSSSATGAGARFGHSGSLSRRCLAETITLTHIISCFTKQVIIHSLWH